MPKAVRRATMKLCPKCNLKYEDTLSFCLEDGTGLIKLNEPEETLVLPYARLRPSVPITPLPRSASQRSSIRLLYAIILLLAVFAAGVSVALFYERDKLTANVQLQPTSSNTTISQNPLPQSASPTPGKITENHNRYTVTSCGSIQDTRTNLEWFVGPDRNTTWYEARQWATGLQTCDGGWRLPSLEEIRTLYDPGSYAGTGYYTRGQYWPAHMDPVFNRIGGGSWIWSDKQTGNGNAHSFNMNQGKPVEYSATDIIFSTRAFAVRRARS